MKVLKENFTLGEHPLNIKANQRFSQTKADNYQQSCII
jgi:hypothetical protein